ncbi:hypothetical protein BS50DRAFT_591666 [Corynespora cassiicola Philippines]|uniref:Uncharacterized protein n=1 Tax=Corynespora cassiicola Philippines TaxID=1448308 RepID=A0A2T2NAE1_CORCC|nr:hypothetical protein BS50DRAFT_591666 [Corynespora cassiicola Philippines]
MTFFKIFHRKDKQKANRTNESPVLSEEQKDAEYEVVDDSEIEELYCLRGLDHEPKQERVHNSWLGKQLIACKVHKTWPITLIPKGATLLQQVAQRPVFERRIWLEELEEPWLFAYLYLDQAKLNEFARGRHWAILAQVAFVCQVVKGEITGNQIIVTVSKMDGIYPELDQALLDWVYSRFAVDSPFKVFIIERVVKGNALEKFSGPIAFFKDVCDYITTRDIRNVDIPTQFDVVDADWEILEESAADDKERTRRLTSLQEANAADILATNASVLTASLDQRVYAPTLSSHPSYVGNKIEHDTSADPSKRHKKDNSISRLKPLSVAVPPRRKYHDWPPSAQLGYLPIPLPEVPPGARIPMLSEVVAPLSRPGPESKRPKVMLEGSTDVLSHSWRTKFLSSNQKPMDRSSGHKMSIGSDYKGISRRAGEQESQALQHEQQPAASSNKNAGMPSRRGSVREEPHISKSNLTFAGNQRSGSLQYSNSVLRCNRQLSPAGDGHGPNVQKPFRQPRGPPQVEDLLRGKENFKGMVPQGKEW